MPSPFPGMDPYLEAPSLWEDVHTRLTTTISNMLGQAVPEQFFVGVEQYVYVVDPLTVGRTAIRPDVHVQEPPGAAGEPIQHTGDGGRTTVASPTLVRAPELASLEIHIPYITITDTHDHTIVTIIEIVSPVNKQQGTKGYSDFYAKREKVLYSRTHWIEIDLLRKGYRALQWAHNYDYYIALHRGDSGDPLLLSVWGIDVRERLPRIPVPLRAPYDDCSLDLQEALNAVYEHAHYERVIDYSNHHALGLAAADLPWLTERLVSRRSSGGLGRSLPNSRRHEEDR